MPFTPFHMGPALAIKAIAGHRFSVLTFGLAQVAMDIEPLVGLFRGADVLHGPTHTYLSALGMAVAVAFAAPTICRPILRRWNRELPTRAKWLVEPESFAPGMVFTSAFVGTFSHVILDSVMHPDISPVLPWSHTNALFGLISIEALHLFCVFCGAAGVVGWLWAGWRKRRLETS